jgi:hypothetical protein
MLKSFIYKLTKHFGNVGSTLIAVALIAIVFEQVKLIQSALLLGLGIILIVITSFILLKENNND